MLRELNINEMNLVSGGTAGGSGDEIIATGTIIRHSTDTGTGFQQNPVGLMSEALGAAGNGIAATMAGVVADLNSQGINGVVPAPPPTLTPVPPTPPETPTADGGSPGEITPAEGIKCGLISNENSRNRCLANAMLR